MNQHRFEQLHQEQWTNFEQLLTRLEGAKRTEDESLADFPSLYRHICNQYSIAQVRHYSPALVDRLHQLVLRGHRQLYKKKSNIVWGLLSFISRDFPQEVRRSRAIFWLAFLLFYLPAGLVGLATYHNPSLIYSVLGEDQVIQMETMYDPTSRKPGRGNRDSQTDLAMFGHYIFNNISIGFRTFGMGLSFGVGTLALLLFNGLVLGSVAGYLSHPPYTLTFWQFVPGHGAFELTAIVISGAAGLRLGLALIAPGRHRRLDALRLQAPSALRLAGGAALFFLIAAFIEAFWSSSPVSPAVKFWVAGANVLLVTLYLLLAGRRPHES